MLDLIIGFNDYFNDWYSQLYAGGSMDDWCHSHLPEFSNRGAGSVLRSEACCPVIIHGTFDYFIVDDNVKTYGTK